MRVLVAIVISPKTIFQRKFDGHGSGAIPESRFPITGMMIGIRGEHIPVQQFSRDLVPGFPSRTTPMIRVHVQQHGAIWTGVEERWHSRGIVGWSFTSIDRGIRVSVTFVVVVVVFSTSSKRSKIMRQAVVLWRCGDKTTVRGLVLLLLLLLLLWYTAADRTSKVPRRRKRFATIPLFIVTTAGSHVGTTSGFSPSVLFCEEECKNGKYIKNV